jgi:hypothetical protein
VYSPPFLELGEIGDGFTTMAAVLAGKEEKGMWEGSRKKQYPANNSS